MRWIGVLMAAVLIAPPAGADGPQTRFVVLRPYGFEPGSIRAEPGLVVLMVLNRSGLKECTLRLDREAGNRVIEFQVPRHKPNWGGSLTLTPGSYLLTVVERPGWVCRITVGQ